MTRPTKDTQQVTFRVPSDWLDRADELAIQMTDEEDGIQHTRTDVFRKAIAIGLGELERRRA